MNTVSGDQSHFSMAAIDTILPKMDHTGIEYMGHFLEHNHDFYCFHKYSCGVALTQIEQTYKYEVLSRSLLHTCTLYGKCLDPDFTWIIILLIIF